MKTDFNRHFGKKWTPWFKGLFFRILSGVFLVTLFAVLFLANFDYTRFEPALKQSFKKHFKDWVVQLEKPESYNITVPQVTTGGNLLSSPARQMSLREKTEHKVESLGVLKALKDPYGNLPEIEDLNDGGLEFDELTYTGDNTIPTASFVHKNHQGRAGYEHRPAEELMRDPYKYKIKRKQAIFISNTADVLQEDKVRFGYRDQTEIMTYMYAKQASIEACYKKATRNYSISSGFIKVEFQISPAGYVLGHSIRILDSSLHNRILEQCIKKNIRRWRGFKKLDNSRGIARVVHKFIFY